MSNVFEFSRRYIGAGWSIVPCPRGQKYPSISWSEWQKKVPTLDQLRVWDLNEELEAVAIVTGRLSGIIAVDVDPRKGGTTDGLPTTGCVAKTGGGGYHYVYRYPTGVKVVENATNIKPGIDIRGDGGIILAAPSLHVCDLRPGPNKCPKPCPRRTQRYEWVEFDPDNLGNAPKWTYERKQKESAQQEDKSKKWIANLLRNMPEEGTWNDSTTRLVGYLASLRGPMPPDIAEAFVTSWMSRAEDPLPSHEIETIIHSVYKTEEKNTKVFATLSLSEMMLKHGSEEVKWCVSQWLPDSTIGFLVSPPSGYKTWFSFDLAASVATGQPFLEKYEVLNPGPVLIIQQEDFAGDIASRNGLVLLVRCGIDPPSSDGDEFSAPRMLSDSQVPIRFHTERKLKFEDEKIMDALEEVIVQYGVRLCIIDPLYAAGRLDDFLVETTQKMMRLKDIRDRTKCGFLVVHHTKKAGEGWERQNLWGSQFVNAFMESGFFVRRAQNKSKIVMQRFFKSAGVQPHTEIQFDIDTKENQYRVTTRDISAEEAAAFASSNIEDDITRLLTKPMTLQDIASALQKNEKEVKQSLRKLTKLGAVSLGADSKYRYTPENEEDDD